MMFTPTVLEPYVVVVRLDGREVELVVWDTAGQEEYERLRPLSYPGTHAVLICYSIDYPDSLENVPVKVSIAHKIRHLKLTHYI
jgi:Ras family protein A